jgi:uncharacterized protein YhaN
MRFLDLQLLRFGPFADRLLNFTVDGSDLHLLHGSNEAGKSTTLRAVTGLLFGIPETTRDHHTYDMRDLRIGARLESRVNGQLQVIRRKGRKNTLLDANEQPLDDAILTPFLGGINRELFETLFGLSHESLVRGGQDLLAGRGEVGESLFGAGLGIRGIHALRSKLQLETDALFTPGAQKRPLNLALKQFQEAKKRATQLLLRPQQWQELQKRLQEAENELTEREHNQAKVSAELQRLQRLKRVLPQLRTREELLSRQQALGQVRLLPESCAIERAQALQRLHSSELQTRKRQDERQRCEQERALLQVPEALLAQEAMLERLRDRLGAYRKAMSDLPGLTAKVTAAHEEALRILRELGHTDTLDDVEKLRIDVASQERIRRLAQEGTRLETELARAQKDSAEARQTLLKLKRFQEVLPPHRDASALQRAVAEIRRRGDLEAQLQTLETESATLREQANQQLAALWLWQGPLEQAAALPLPPRETVERYRSDLESLANERQLTEERRKKASEQLEKTTTHITALEARGVVPSEAELHTARSQRDTLWRQIRTAWLEKAPTADIDSLASTYEQAGKQADMAADQLWQNAERAAQHAALCIERTRHMDDIARLEAQLDELAGRETAQQSAWCDLWQGASIVPLPPAEMRSWLERHASLAELILQLKNKETAHTGLLAEIERHRERCSLLLADLNAPVATVKESLAELLQRTEQFAADLGTVETQRSQLQRDLEKAANDVGARQETLDQCKRALQDWHAQWGQAVRSLGLDSEAGCAEAEAMLGGLSRLFHQLDAARSDQNRIDHIGSDASQFAAEVAELVHTCAPDLAGMAPDAAAAELVNRLTKGKETRRDRNNLDARLKQLHKELEELRRDQEDAQATLARLQAQAEVDTPEALEAAEQRSREYRGLTTRLTDIEEQLLTEGLSLVTLLTQAQAVDADQLPADIARLEETSAACAREGTRCREQVWQLRNELNTMDGRSQAADANAEAQEALAEIKAQVETYTRLKLSALLLSREIEAYRKRNQGPIMERAGEFFRRMTLNAFTELSIGFAENDQMVLLCVRADGRKVPVEGLSEGTRDQLYLALRLASLERYVEGDPPPLVVDDILINFDDQRAGATLALLGELAEKTQVLFFTHHRRLLELAREVIPGKRFQEHDLDQFALD